MTTRKNIKINGKYIGTYSLDEIYEESSFISLCKKINDDTTLRDFFIRNKFSDHFNGKGKSKLIYGFIKNTSLFPSILTKSRERNLFYFFYLMRLESDVVFHKKLNKITSDVCTSAQDMGLFAPETYTIDVERELHLIPSERYSNEEPIAIFYRICDPLVELWIKNEEKGKMLEVWVYELLKDHFHREDLNIIYSIKIEESTKESSFIDIKDFLNKVDVIEDVKDFSNDVPDTDHITELDTSIKISDKIKIIIECKMKASWPDVIKLHGTLNLLRVPYGIIISGNKVANFPDIREFENIKIYNGVIDNPDFPQSLEDYLSELVDIGPT